MATLPRSAKAPAVLGRRRRLFGVVGGSRPSLDQWFSGDPGIASISPSDVEHGQTGVVISGSDFGATQGAGGVEIGDGPVYATAAKVTQTVTSWADGSITITVNLGAQSPGPKWVYVTSGASVVSVPANVWVHRAAAVHLSLSTNIAAAAADATTARLTAPTGTFQAGVRTDDTNPLPAEAFAAGGFTEVEASIIVTSDAVGGEDYEFRIVRLADDGSVVPLDGYTFTPQLSISGGTSHDRTAADGSTATDAGARTQGGARSRAETATATDAGARSSTQARSAADGSTATDAASHQLSKIVSAAEAATAADASSRVAATARSRAETSTASDAGARTVGQARAAAEASTATDTATAAEAAARSRADSSTASDSGARAQGVARARAEASTATDAASRTGAALRASAETATATDGVTHELIVGGQLTSSASDGSTSTDSGTRVAGQSRAQADTSTATDAQARAATQARSATETPTASDASARSGGFVRSRAETATATDGATHQLILGGVAHSRSASDVSTATDAASRATTGLRSPVEAAVGLDVMVRTLTALRAPQEAASASDGFLVVLDGGVRADVAVCVLLVRAIGTAELLPSASARLLGSPTAELLRKCC